MKKILLVIILSAIIISTLLLPSASASDSIPKGYVAYLDSSNCPVKVLAYRIVYIESGETTVNLLIKNKSDLRVVGFQGTLELFDKAGKNVDSVQGDPIFLFKDRLPLPVDSQPIEGTSFVIEEGHRVTTVKPQITQILFEDQSIWRGF